MIDDRTLSPVILFVYNRPWHTEQTLNALAENELASETVLYIYADGPKENASPEILEKIKSTRALLRSRQWCKEVHVIESDKNVGLANSVIAGITEIVNRHSKIIVLEDDILTSKYFLRYLNDGLALYQNTCNVYAINSYMFPIQTDKVDTFLSPLGTSTWGWATWADKWKAFENVPRYKQEIQTNPFLRSRFNLADYNYADMLNNTNSWGIRWYYSVFARNGLGLFPTRSLSLNIGFGNDATHTKETFSQFETHGEKIELIFKERVDWQMQQKLLEYFTNSKKKGAVSNILDRMQKIFR